VCVHAPMELCVGTGEAKGSAACLCSPWSVGVWSGYSDGDQHSPWSERIPESQHGGVGRDLCGSPSPTPCPSRVTQSRLHSTTSRWVLNISREGDSPTSLGEVRTRLRMSSQGDGLISYTLRSRVVIKCHRARGEGLGSPVQER